MVLLSASGITKSYGIDTILSGISFHINAGDRVGVVGDNGAGKSTLLSILSGELSTDTGDLYRSSDLSIGYLKQRDGFSSTLTVWEEMTSIFAKLIEMEVVMSDLSHQIAQRSSGGEDVSALLEQYDSLQNEYHRSNGYGYQSEIAGVLSKMAFPEATYQKTINTLSGGERTRLALASLLLKKPDLLLLDEPTNHLDIGTLNWLEQYLSSYSGTLVMISHDRYFLDQTANRIFEVANQSLSIYEGNYTAFVEKKQNKEQDTVRQYERQQKEIARQEEIIRRFKGHGTEKLVKRAQSREKRLDHIERLERPNLNQQTMRLQFRESFKSGNDVLLARDVSMGFDLHGQRRLLFDQLNFEVKRGERICLVGPNGVGKTTFLKLCMGLLEPRTGAIEVGHNVAFGYYDQEQQLLVGSRTVLEEMQEAYRLYTQTELRSLLGRFLFHGDDVFKKVDALSGGERAKLSLLKLMLSGANVLVMDEPTNHLDISAKEVFEDALLEFPGTLLIVSHDRYLLNKIPTRICELSTHGIETYLGAYEYYMEKKQSAGNGQSYLSFLGKEFDSTSTVLSDGEDSIAQKEQKKEDRRKLKEQDAKKRRTEREVLAAEQEIEQLETELLALEAEMGRESIISDYDALTEYSTRLAEVKAALEGCYDRWASLQEFEK